MSAAGSIEDECFGGERASGLGAMGARGRLDSTAISASYYGGGERSNNAYLLFYERADDDSDAADVGGAGGGGESKGDVGGVAGVSARMAELSCRRPPRRKRATPA